MAKKIAVTLVRRPITCTQKQRRTLNALGLQKVGRQVEHSDTPEIRGMIRVVDFLVNVEEI